MALLGNMDTTIVTFQTTSCNLAADIRVRSKFIGETNLHSYICIFAYVTKCCIPKHFVKLQVGILYSIHKSPLSKASFKYKISTETNTLKNSICVGLMIYSFLGCPRV